MLRIFILFLCFIYFFKSVNGQSESNNFTTYDTSCVFSTGQFSAPDRWNLRISRSIDDTSQRPAICMMPGQGEQGVNNLNKLTVYGPHYWLANGWDGGITLGNGKHFPILITVCYLNNVYPTAPSYYTLLNFLLKTYPIKRSSFFLTGLSQGAFSAGAVIQYEATAGAETGMSIIKAMALFEGTPDPLPAPYSTWSRGFVAYAVWAKKYGGRYFYLEGSGSDNFRDGWQYANAMNAAVPGSAYFSYENIGGGAHCCWNGMYDPKVTNWTSVGKLGSYNASSQAGTNTIGTYSAPSNVFQWLLRQGDTTLVGSNKPPPINQPPVIILTPPVDTIYLPVDSAIILENKSYDPDGIIVGCTWQQISGPTVKMTVRTDNSIVINNLDNAGNYSFQITLTDNKGAASTFIANIVVIPIVNNKIIIFTIALKDGKYFILYADGTYLLQ
jgi:hypothetical protein